VNIDPCDSNSASSRTCPSTVASPNRSTRPAKRAPWSSHRLHWVDCPTHDEPELPVRPRCPAATKINTNKLSQQVTKWFIWRQSLVVICWGGSQWRQLHGHGGTCPQLLQMAGQRGTVNRGTADKKLTKLYWPTQKRSPKRSIVLVEPKKVKGHDKKKIPALSPDVWLRF